MIAGESAGGTLTVTTLIMAKRAGLPMPAAAVAFSPSLDATRSGASMYTKAGIDPFLTREDLLAKDRALYLAGADPHQELLSAATLADAAGFPPMLFQAGGNEVLLDDAVRMAERARYAVVDVILDITADVPPSSRPTPASSTKPTRHSSAPPCSSTSTSQPQQDTTRQDR